MLLLGNSPPFFESRLVMDFPFDRKNNQPSTLPQAGQSNLTLFVPGIGCFFTLLIFFPHPGHLPLGTSEVP